MRMGTTEQHQVRAIQHPAVVNMGTEAWGIEIHTDAEGVPTDTYIWSGGEVVAGNTNGDRQEAASIIARWANYSDAGISANTQGW